MVDTYRDREINNQTGVHCTTTTTQRSLLCSHLVGALDHRTDEIMHMDVLYRAARGQHMQHMRSAADRSRNWLALDGGEERRLCS